VSDLYLTKTRLDLLRAIAGGRVTMRQSGAIVRSFRVGPHRRADAATRELARAGWARLGPDGGTYEPTDVGRALLDGGAG
jgi:hypothetical protein